MIVTFSQTPDNFGTHHEIDRKGKHILVYKDAGTYEFTRNAKKSPTKHLTIYKYTKKIINKLLHFIDSNFFYED